MLTPMRSRPPPSLGLFVGRERELARLQALGTERLATLRGTAGIGKTRLAVEHLRRTREPYVFVDLTEAASADALESCVGRALGVPPSTAGSDESLDTLLAAAGER